MTALEQNKYNLSRAADQLKITRHALRYRINRLGIKVEDDGEEKIEDVK
jgi:transcriptional regulator with GAF, ATPase, and Fis domain